MLPNFGIVKKTLKTWKTEKYVFLKIFKRDGAFLTETTSKSTFKDVVYRKWFVYVPQTVCVCTANGLCMYRKRLVNVPQTVGELWPKHWIWVTVVTRSVLTGKRCFKIFEEEKLSNFDCLRNSRQRARMFVLITSVASCNASSHFTLDSDYHNTKVVKSFCTFSCSIVWHG